MREKALYVHIPFCQGICPYCDFNKTLYRPEWGERFTSKLLGEIAALTGPFSSIYLGGGTPTCLSLPLLREILSALRGLLEKGGEFDIEGNPESFDMPLCRLLFDCGITRVSIGAQSSIDAILHPLGRRHRHADTVRAIANLLQSGIENINLDLIYAGPNSSVETARLDAEAFSSLPITHVSAYSLILEKGTYFSFSGVKELSQDEQGAQFEVISEVLNRRGMSRYEVSSFCKKGRECAHNLAYWEDKPYLALGPGASGYDGNAHYSIKRGLFEYFEFGSRRVYEQEGEKDKIEIFLLTNLRLAKGFSLDRFRRLFGEAELERVLSKAKPMAEAGLLRISDCRLSPTERGLNLLDSVLVSLF